MLKYDNALKQISEGHKKAGNVKHCQLSETP
jgi:hypothetical protein